MTFIYIAFFLSSFFSQARHSWWIRRNIGANVCSMKAQEKQGWFGVMKAGILLSNLHRKWLGCPGAAPVFLLQLDSPGAPTVHRCFRSWQDSVGWELSRCPVFSFSPSFLFLSSDILHCCSLSQGHQTKRLLNTSQLLKSNTLHKGGNREHWF